MTAEQQSAAVEIGHILFMDIVGFSKLLGDEQNELSQRLNQVVRNTESFRAAEAADKLIRLPTGDGMALVFFTGPESPLQCAVEISRALDSSIPLRIGIHSGPINKAIDVDGRTNVTGSGINMAQRLMDLGDAGHILLSKRIAEDLAHYSKWQPHLHELGQAEVKHGAKIDIFNFYTDEIGNRATPTKFKTAAPRSGFQRWAAASLGAIALIAAILFVTYRFHARSTSTLPPVPERSVAIFPFKPLIAQNRDEFLENGMADTLIAKLSTIRDIIIPALTSARKYDEQEHDPIAAGRLLRVRSVLDGSLQKLGDKIRVTARLINVADGRSLWTQTFDEKFTDVFAVQDTIAQKVADALAVRLSGEQQQRLTKHYTDNTEAYQLYLKGRFYWNRFTDEAFRKSIDYFNQALQKDANYALAYAGLADSYSLMSEIGFFPADQGFPKGRAYAEKALALDPDLSDAHLSLGIVILFADQQIAGAEKELRRAIELNPSNAQAHHYLGHALEFSYRVKEALAEKKRGLELDPTNSILGLEVGMTYLFARDYNAALAQLEKTRELDPNFTFISGLLVEAYEFAGRYQDAVAELDRAERIQGQPVADQFVMRAHVYAKMGRAAEARQILEEMLRAPAQWWSGTSWVYSALGEKDAAFDVLNRAFDAHETMLFMRCEPLFDDLRSDPRFDALLKRLDSMQQR
jgi:TolB-like protein/lipoprotein NlpI